MASHSTYISPNDQVLDRVRANKTFDRHEITRERFGVWYCGAKDTGNMSFRVVVAPGMLMLYGDIGEIIFLPYAKNTLAWAVGSFQPEYPYYPMTKLSHHMREKEFQSDEVEGWLLEKVRENRKSRDNKWTKHYIDLVRRWRESDRDGLHQAERSWHELCYTSNLDDPPTFTDYPTGIYLCFQAMCWFMSHVSADDPRFSEELK